MKSKNNSQDQINFSNLLKQYEQELSQHSYSRGTINLQFGILKKIYSKDEVFKESDFPFEKAKKWLNEQLKRKEQGKISHNYYIFMRTCILKFQQFYHDGYLKILVYSEKPKNLNEPYFSVHQDFLCSFSQNLAASTIQLHETNSRQFFKYLESQSIFEFKLITRELINSFLADAFTHHQRSMDKVIQALKFLFSYLHNKNLINFIPDFTMMKPVYRRKPVLPRFSYEDVNEILSAIDKTSSVGKRDYALITAAIYTGLRLHDILNLKLTDIDWKKNEVKIIQKKTINSLCLPLCAELGNALADYILYGRPHTKEKHIFLKSVPPYSHLIGNPFNDLLLRCYKINPALKERSAGKTFHSFRRSFGSWLSIEQTPLPLISEILGHTNLESAKFYLSYDNVHMSMCCLGLDGISIGKEGLL